VKTKLTATMALYAGIQGRFQP